MLQYTTPAQAGIDEKAIRAFMKQVLHDRINLHSVLMMKGDQVFFEKYWAPFRPDQPHRMYSVTKSFVAIAIGFLSQEGKLSLQDPIIRFFPDKLGKKVDPLLATQTIEHMLTMQTCFYTGNWFQPQVTDRLAFYFQRPAEKVPGTLWNYDSNGSYVLGCLVERLSGMELLDYLKEKVLDRLGAFQQAHILSTMDGTPWADSAMICSTRDLAAFARFVMNGGAWEGQQLLDAGYVRAAVSCQVDNDLTDRYDYNSFGYGYQFWRTEQNSYSMNGMGGQFAICVPDQDLIFVCTADDQLSAVTDSPRIYRAFFDHIVGAEQNKCGIENQEKICCQGASSDRKTEANPSLVEDNPSFVVVNPSPTDEFDLDQPLEISVARGKSSSPWAQKIQDQTFLCRENPMGWKNFRFHFAAEKSNPYSTQEAISSNLDQEALLSQSPDVCSLIYENQQGVKEIRFGMKKNIFGHFPQYGYSDEYGNRHEITDFLYQDAVSAGWVEERKLQIRVQIIDRYLGLLVMTFGFTPDGKATVSMQKAAEDFFNEYEGYLIAESI